MKTVTLAFIAAAVAVLTGACNSVGSCPASAQVVPGGSCSGDNLQCPYTLGPDDGGVATSCVCTNGNWSCPSEEAGGDDGGSDGAAPGDATAGDSSVAEGGSAEASAGDASATDSSAIDASTSDAAGKPDAPADASGD